MVNDMDDKKRDEARLARLCLKYQDGDFQSDDEFTESVLDVVSGWDALTQSASLLPRVEATLEKHFCDLWEECAEGRCIYQADRKVWLEDRMSYTKFYLTLDMRMAFDDAEKIRPGIRYEILKRDLGRCQVCGATAKQGAQLEVDHIIPKSKGGKSDANNLWTLCFACNRGKGNRAV
jgi:5-methylcytosine-specific restriction endonuclease McrA